MAMGAREGDAPSGPRRGRGRTEQAVERALRAQAERDARYAAIEAVTLLLGRALDGASAAGDPYAIGQIAPRMLEALRELRLTPATAPAGGDDLAELLSSLTRPEVGHTP